MKARPRSCLLTLALSLTLAGSALAQSLAGNRFPKSATGGALPAVACGPIFLTHSVSQDIISANSIACFDAGSGFG